MRHTVLSSFHKRSSFMNQLVLQMALIGNEMNFDIQHITNNMDFITMFNVVEL